MTPNYTPNEQALFDKVFSDEYIAGGRTKAAAATAHTAATEAVEAERAQRRAMAASVREQIKRVVGS